MRGITDEQENKLPKYARDYIDDLRRERHSAIKALADFTNNQKPAPFYVDDMVHLHGSPENARSYIQSRWIRMEHKGLKLDILLRDDERVPCVDIQYSTSNSVIGDIMLQPRSYQLLRLLCPIEKGKKV